MDARKLLAIRESLDTVWGFLLLLEDPEGDQAAQEFGSLLTTIARHRNDDKLWALIGEWAGEKA